MKKSRQQDTKMVSEAVGPFRETLRWQTGYGHCRTIGGWLRITPVYELAE